MAKQYKNRYEYTYYSMDEWLTYNRSVMANDRHGSGTRTYDPSWSGSANYDEAERIARQGWPEGRSKLVNALVAAGGMQSAQAPSKTLDVAGAYPVCALAAAGDPACMIDLYESDIKTRPILKIMFNFVCSAAYDADEFIKYGAAVLSYIDALEANGNRCELWACYYATIGSDNLYNCQICIKKAEEPVEIDRLAFAFAHPSMLRRLGFVHLQSNPETAHINTCSGGKVIELERRDDMLTISGLNTLLSPGQAKRLSIPAICDMLKPQMEAQLAELGAESPTLVWLGETLR